MNKVSRTSIIIQNPPQLTVCSVNDLKKLMVNLKLEGAEGHKQLKRFVNGEIKILTCDEYQFRRTIKILEEEKVEYHRYQLKTEKKIRLVIRGLHSVTDTFRHYYKNNLRYFLKKSGKPKKNINFFGLIQK